MKPIHMQTLITSNYHITERTYLIISREEGEKYIFIRRCTRQTTDRVRSILNLSLEAKGQKVCRTNHIKYSGRLESRMHNRRATSAMLERVIISYQTRVMKIKKRGKAWKILWTLLHHKYASNFLKKINGIFYR